MAPIPQPQPQQPGGFLLARQTPTKTIPASYGALYTSLDPGAIAGIVLGSVAGFCLILWLFYACINMGNVDSTTEGTASVVTRKSHHHTHRHRSASAHRRSRNIEITRTTREQSRGPVVVEERMGGGGVDGVILEETRRRSYSRGGGGGGGVRRVVEVSDDDTADTGGDEVVVIEEHSPVRGGSRRRERSRIRSQERRSGGYDRERVVEVRRSASRVR
ncbi:hypothetical protein QBC40DRAFT_328274 [Triangularia verruculosa]|uniref:Uncharacterized protein n=1 Tax=Triangularia verruculosa TaxID=2587418 RepID=A0AAN6XJI8_9PEZI|nr:hypothetical protein QBC40DRAFT_328274 [Triangularia verruculosa]